MAAPREGGQLGNGTLQPTPGFQAFGTNIVPTGSQGQPYRGGQAAVQEGSERGRDTPPPPRTGEMTEDETMNYSQLQKDYKELSESLYEATEWISAYKHVQGTNTRKLRNTTLRRNPRSINCRTH